MIYKLSLIGLNLSIWEMATKKAPTYQKECVGEGLKYVRFIGS